jgi:hypothetical protein
MLPGGLQQASDVDEVAEHRAMARALTGGTSIRSDEGR